MTNPDLLEALTEGCRGKPAQRITDWLEKDLILYGAGSGYYSFASFVLGKYALTPSKILDQRFANEPEFQGIPAGNIESLTASDEEKSNAIIIVTLGKPALAETIKQQFLDQGFSHVFWAFEFFEYSLHHTPVAEIEQIDSLLRNESSVIEQAFGLMADDESKLLFRNILATYLRSEIITLPSRPLTEQYFAEDILTKGFTAFIDCGAYTGDTIDEIVNRGTNLQTVVCFEPDPDNYARLLANPNLKKANRAETYPFALGASESLLSLSPNNTNSSVISGGDIQIRSVAIDEVIGDIAPTYIKMDIEGAEPEALVGAQKIIRRYKPDLAISIYHLVNHLWRLPVQIASMNSGYKLYLRNYTGFISETVLYANQP